MKKLLTFTMLFIPSIGIASANENLNYCATTESWAAHKVITSAVRKNNQLDKYQAKSILINRHLLEKNKSPITYSEWGKLYSQTIEVTIPYIDKDKSPMIIIASSIISAEECSFSDPTYIDITPKSY
ncbi:hypothetical protein [Xenorhabdus innexi]|uniref:Uncharacterized protein n=1 Tax=Xenorhabdus innexi TaxID=290109 RepID=A0A1N6MWE5_9GAMM|nr:hypothetical protein [Xenorhabdus innexi]PHM36585.1 exported hypothetical protein [Xenorhabdus innexi]SIP73132.1 exported hypothetical protein [Xenorhabdus innexi]